MVIYLQISPDSNINFTYKCYWYVNCKASFYRKPDYRIRTINIYILKRMHVEEIKKQNAASEEMRTKLYISHKRLALNRSPENFENFKITVDKYRKMLAEMNCSAGSSPSLNSPD